MAIKHKPRSVSRDIYETMITMYIKKNKKQNKKYVKTNNTKQNKTKNNYNKKQQKKKKQTNKQADDRLNRADLSIEQGIK